MSPKPNPDFEQMKKVLFRQGIPEKIPFYELFVDGEIMDAIIKKPLTKLDINKKDEKQQLVKWTIEFYYNTGYDFEKFKWRAPESIDFLALEFMSKNIPDCMKIIPLGPSALSH